MSEFRFASPERVHAVWGVLLLAALLVSFELRAGGALDRFISRALAARLVARPSRPRRLLRAALLSLSALCLVLALMRPQLGLTYISTPRVGARIMVCLDVSRSMLAEDVVPNRLERAKAEVRDLLPLLEGDQVGLIAFAGRASILCPLTPDFSFLRLVLDGVSANSVGRGGTRLEEPIRKAIEAFGEAGDAARAILLVTDGEDHDSFPLEACDAAKERGIQVIAIGFGDEGGSPVVITDPETGAREPLRDRDGNIVRSRLDGETLREMALRTEGIYIPAGTRALDLEEIHRNAIAPLVRSRIEGGGRTVRQEAYQWPAIGALLLLLGSALATARPRAPLGAALALLLAIALPHPAPLSAQSGAPADAAPSGAGDGTAPDTTRDAAPDATPDATPDTTPDTPAGPAPGSGAPPAPAEDPDAGLDPRLLHNRALDDLAAGELAAARRRFERAESGSGIDAELRYRCRYHLGWIDVEEADATLAEDPEGALHSLEAAAERFRDAVRVRPEGAEARHNLEVVLRRIRELADSLRQEEAADLAGRLEALIERQRGLLGETRSLAERDAADPGGADAEPRRREVQAVAATEREILGDLESFARDADLERRTIAAKPEEERTPEDRLREAQLGALLEHITRAQERIGQARRTLRRQQTERAARRASLGLSSLKRAREQLRDPLQVLDGILPDAESLLRQGIELVRAETPAFGTERAAPAPWLSAAALGEESEEVRGRVEELAARFRGAAGADIPAEAADPEAAARARLLEQVRAALPHLEAATAAYGEASAAYGEERARDALAPADAGLAALRAAQGLFFDTKRLIEQLWRDEKIVLALLRGDDGAEEAMRRARIGALGELHGKNRARMDRLDELLAAEEAEIDSAESAPADPQAAPPSPEDIELLRQRLALARTLAAEARTRLDAAGEWFAAQESVPAEAVTLADGIGAVEAALPPIEQLRRLYFTIIEHLRELARRQEELVDRTADALAAAPEEVAPLLAPIVPEQEQLRRIAGELAPALAEQAESAGSAPPAPAAPGVDPAERGKAIARAAELVASAGAEMERATAALSAADSSPAPPRGEEGSAAQRAALEQLIEALLLLEPPEQQPPADPSPSEEEASEGEEPEREPRREPVDPAQLLQAVRDREAKRRAEQQRAGAEDPSVEKDW